LVEEINKIVCDIEPSICFRIVTNMHRAIEIAVRENQQKLKNVKINSDEKTKFTRKRMPENNENDTIEDLRKRKHI